MSAQESIQSNARLTSSQQTMVERWEEHLRDEFELRNVDKTMETMESVSTLATALAFLRGEHRRLGFAALLATLWRHECCCTRLRS